MAVRPKIEEANAATKTKGSTLQQQATAEETQGVELKGTQTTPHRDLQRGTEMYAADVVSQRVVTTTMTIKVEAVAVAVRVVVGSKVAETALEEDLASVSVILGEPC